MAEVQWSGWQLSDLHKMRGFSGLLQGRGTVIFDPYRSLLILNRFQHISTWIFDVRCLGFVACLMNCKNTVWRKFRKFVLELRTHVFPHRRLISKCGVRIWRMAIRSGKRINVQAAKMRLTPTWRENRAPSFERSCDRREPTMLMAAVLNLNRF